MLFCGAVAVAVHVFEGVAGPCFTGSDAIGAQDAVPFGGGDRGHAETAEMGFSVAAIAKNHLRNRGVKRCKGCYKGQ